MGRTSKAMRRVAGKVGVMGSTVWQCEQMRAGQVYGKVLFPTRGEAEKFMKQMERAQPDLFWRLAQVAAADVWN